MGLKTLTELSGGALGLSLHKRLWWRLIRVVLSATRCRCGSPSFGRPRLAEHESSCFHTDERSDFLSTWNGKPPHDHLKMVFPLRVVPSHIETPINCGLSSSNTR